MTNQVLRKISRNDSIRHHDISFSPFPELYLEYLENKERIIPAILEGTYDPPSVSSSSGGSFSIEGFSASQNSNSASSSDYGNSIEKGADDGDDFDKAFGGKDKHHRKRHKHSSKKKKEQKPEPPKPKTKDEIEEDKTELLFKFKMMKKSYPHADIPEFSIHSDLRLMERSYKQTLRSLSIDSSVESYRGYLYLGFCATEWLGCNVMKLDLKGFSQEQMLQMNKYDRLLIELGEKSYSPLGSDLPVEVRLLGLVMIQAVMFMFSKLIKDSTGISFTRPVQHKSGKKKKMRGPHMLHSDSDDDE